MMKCCGAALRPGLIAILLLGCSTERDDASIEVPDVSLTGTSWQVEDIDQRGIIDASNATVEFIEDGRIAGRGSCNRYFGGVSIDGSSLSFTNMGATQMACAEALMNQEQRFFAALGEVTSFRIDENSFLILLDGSGAERLRLIGIEPESTVERAPDDEPLDRALETSTAFDCGDAGIVEMRFVGPETIELTLADRSGILQRVRTASGARYADDNLDFWNRGDEAMLTVDGERFDCARQP